jgi:hypothetical protein
MTSRPAPPPARRIARNVVTALWALGLAAGCPSEGGGGPAGSASSAAPAASASAPTAPASAAESDEPKPRKLDPLSVTLELPASATIEESPTKNTMVTDGDDHFSVSKLDRTFEAEKTQIKNFPFDTFKKWVKEEPTLAVAEFGESPPNYRAIIVVDVAGTKYWCQNTGTRGVASAEEAERVVKRCLGLKPAT